MPARRKRPWQGQPPPGTTIEWGDPLAEGLVGAWGFSEGAGQRTADAAQNNPAAFTAAPTWVPGRRGRAVSLNGTTQYATVPFRGSLNTTAIGASFWIRPYSFSNYQTVIGRWNETGNNRVWAVVVFAGGPLYLYRSPDGTNGFTINSSVNLVLNVWTHVVTTLGPSGWSIYFNGTSVANLVGGVSVITTLNTPFYIGFSPVFASAASYFNGAIQNVLLYNRPLSAGDARALYAEPWRPFRAPRLRGEPVGSASGTGAAQARVMVMA